MKKIVLLFILFAVTVVGESMDYSHPKNYVRVYERDENGNKREIFDENVKTSLYEIDVDSKIEIEFNREFIKEKAFDYDIEIEGMVKSGDKSRKIEVGGYSVIGQQKMTAKRSLSEFSEIAEKLKSLHLKSAEEIAFFFSPTVNKISNLNSEKREKVHKIIFNEKDYVLDNLKDISRYDSKVLKLITNNLKSLIKKNQTIENIADNIVKEYEKEDKADLDIIYDGLTDLARYGDLLLDEKGEKTKAYTDIEGLIETPIKDTEILISETGINSSETLIITIKNMGRELKLKFLIKDFGLITTLQDSYFFIKREGEKSYEPIPGLTLGKIYEARKDEKILRTLYPGLGINVSFPQDDSGSTNVSAGITLSLFKNSLIFTAGRDLSREEDAMYYGMGFSFVKLAGKIFRN